MDSQVLRHFDDTIAAETRLVHNLEQQNMSDERWGVLSGRIGERRDLGGLLHRRLDQHRSTVSS